MSPSGGSLLQARADSAAAIRVAEQRGWGADAHIWPRTATIGISSPTMAPSARHHGPAAMITASAPSTATRPEPSAEADTSQPPLAVGRMSSTDWSVRIDAPGSNRLPAEGRGGGYRLGSRSQGIEDRPQQRRIGCRLEVDQLRRAQQFHSTAGPAVGLHGGGGPAPLLLGPQQGQRAGAVEADVVASLLDEVDVPFQAAHFERDVDARSIAPAAAADHPGVESRRLACDLTRSRTVTAAPCSARLNPAETPTMPAPRTMISIPAGYSASAGPASGPFSPSGFEDSDFWDSGSGDRPSSR